MSAKASNMRAERTRISAVYDCLLVKSYQTGKTNLFKDLQCALTDADVNAAYEHYCSPNWPPETKGSGPFYAPCAIDFIGPRTQGLSEAIKDADTAVEVRRARLENVDTCTAVYPATIDKKVSDFTVRQTDQVKTCKDLDQYPPKK
jgi:hypothetical protein